MNPQIGFLLNQSLESLRNSNLESADLYLKQALRLQSDNPHVLRLLGIIYAQRRQYSEALKYLNDSLKALPKNALTLSNLGNVFLELKDYSNALDAYDRSIKIDPKYIEAWSNKGNILHALNRYEEAIAHYDKALNLKPDYAEGWSNKGNTLHELKRYEEAIAHYDKALSVKPDYHEAWTNKGVALHELKRYEESIVQHDKALSLKSDNAEGWSNKGVALHELKRYEESIVQHDKALSLKPDYAEGWSNKGNALRELKCYDEAIAHYDKALNLKPDYHEAWANKGATLHELKCYDEAIAHYDKALSLKPDYHEASWNKSLSLLLQGDFENGLPLYESRWQTEKNTETLDKRFSGKPAWLGVDALQGKTIFIYAEQGLGDFIQFCRYVKLVADLGAKVILEAPQPLAGLMEDLEGVSQLVIKGDELPFFDYQCPLLSLPLAFQTNLHAIPNNASGYIRLDKHSNKILEWKTRLGSKLKPRVGLVWSGNSQHKNDYNRSLLLSDILLYLPDHFEYISLQKEVREVDKLTLDSNPKILSFSSYLNDFIDTAALINDLDFVISVDTSVAHLSGALGKETWVLLSHVPDWRWLLDRGDSPWYPSIKLYRQPSIGDWNSVLDKVKSDLKVRYDISCDYCVLPS